MKISATDNATPGCCGVRQIADFTDDHSDDARYLSGDIIVSGSTEEELCKHFFDTLMRECASGVIYQMWFVKCVDCDDEFPDEYQREPLRELIAALPGVLDLGEGINPNSGNMIQGYQWRAK